MVKRMRLIARLWSGIIAAICLFILFGYIGNFFASGQPDPYAVGNYPPIENIPPFFNLLSAFFTRDSLEMGIFRRYRHDFNSIVSDPCLSDSLAID